MADPDILPPTHNLDKWAPLPRQWKCVWPAVEVLEEEEDDEQAAPKAERPANRYDCGVNE